MKEAFEKFIETMDMSRASDLDLVIAVAGMYKVLEEDVDIPDDVWLLIPPKRRTTVMLGFLTRL